MTTPFSPIQWIEHEGQTLALIVRSSYSLINPGIHFFTPDNFSLQLGYMHHPAGKKIQPHLHNSIFREVKQTQEVLVVRQGKVRVDFYNSQKVYLKSSILMTGDVILLFEGGHGFEILEETTMYEVKQGPYCGESDKTRFEELKENKINLI